MEDKEEKKDKEDKEDKEDTKATANGANKADKTDKDDKEAQAEAKEYGECLAETIETLSDQNQNQEITDIDVRFFDISIMDGKKEIQPATPVSVEIETDPVKVEDPEDVVAVDITEKEEDSKDSDDKADKKKDTVLFIDPGFPVQKMQLQVMGVKLETFDVYDYRGEKLGPKVESYLAKGNICAIVYSNPNNPSWICLNEDELRTIGELATKYDTIVMEDLAYFAMDFRQNLSVPFQPPYQPSVGRYTDNYILLISGSKAFSYAGERIGVTCISDKLFHRHYPDLAQRYEGLPFGLVFSTRMLYALSSGTSHSAQYAMAAMLKAATDGEYDFRKEVSVYGERAHKLKEIFCRHGFHVVYDKDLDQPIADGFYFTIGYKGMTSGELARELMYYGVSAICLITTGSHQEGLRVCTSFIEDHQYAQLEERMAIFEANNQKA